jgi:Family of unknown function (DUF6148)
MPAISLAQAQSQLDSWLAASTAVASNQSYTIGSRSLTRADSKDIREWIKFWRSEVTRLEGSAGGGIRVRGITPT